MENAFLAARVAATPDDDDTTDVTFELDQDTPVATGGALPMALGDLHRLRFLTVADFGLEAVPVGSLPAGLRSLVLYNHACELPDDLDRLAALETLTADNCGLRGVPAALPPSLTRVCLRHNRLAAIPAQLLLLPSLSHLDLSRNRIRALPACVVDATVNSLRLDHNLVAALPQALVAKIKAGQCAIQGIQLANNPINGKPNGRLIDLARYAEAIGATTDFDLNDTEEQQQGALRGPPLAPAERAQEGDVEFLLDDGGVVRGHRRALAARSEFFHAMLEGPLAPAAGAAIPVMGVETAVFEATLAFVYSGELEMEPEALAEVALPWLAYAQEIALDPLCAALTDVVVGGLSAANVSSVLSFASLAHLPELRLRALLWALARFDQVRASASFRRLDKELRDEVRDKHALFAQTGAGRTQALKEGMKQKSSKKSKKKKAGGGAGAAGAAAGAGADRGNGKRRGRRQ